MILTVITGDRKVDIMVKEEQKIGDVYCILSESGCFPAFCREAQIRVYSVRKRAYVDPAAAFGQSEIFNGDILYVFQGREGGV